ncbi:uncharacterized protein C8R40DRAFT_1098821 [Lentinula edodes]|uniref:uncharacterized protein n=1 Tax=Lentinula edodes TaxID=5353 RepID=UPI001E8DF74C|nr:uncharacterized protein C8R40DRAFT_1098821 [Lentinula edodes]KAH7876809.1 hypothetical protein C8R40DRAFT_1098821 [Lentinula edodes]
MTELHLKYSPQRGHGTLSLTPFQLPLSTHDGVTFQLRHLILNTMGVLSVARTQAKFMSFLFTIPIIFSFTIGPTKERKTSAKGDGAHVTEKTKPSQSKPSGESLGLKTPTVIVHHGSSHECTEQNTGLIVACPSDLTAAAIAGIVIGSIIASLILAFVFWKLFSFYRKRRERKRAARANPSTYQQLEGHVHPEGMQDSGYAASISDSGTLVGHDEKMSVSDSVKGYSNV